MCVCIFQSPPTPAQHVLPQAPAAGPDPGDRRRRRRLASRAAAGQHGACLVPFAEIPPKKMRPVSRGPGCPEITCRRGETFAGVNNPALTAGARIFASSFDKLLPTKGEEGGGGWVDG